MGDIFLAHFGPLSTNWASFKCHSLPEYCCWPCPSLYDYSVPSSDGYFQLDNAPCHKAQIISDWFLEHDNEFTLLKWPPQSPDLNPIEHLWDVVEREIHIMDVQPTNLQQLCDAIMSIWTKIQKRNVYNTFLNICHEELRQFWRQRGVQPGTSKVCLIKWPVSVCHIIYIGIYQYAVFLLTYLQFINFQICNLSNNISQIPSFFDSNCKLTCGDFTYFGPYGAKAPKIIYILLDWWLRVQIYGALL